MLLIKHNTQDSPPQQRIIRLQVPTVLRLKNPHPLLWGKWTGELQERKMGNELGGNSHGPGRDNSALDKYSSKRNREVVRFKVCFGDKSDRALR